MLWQKSRRFGAAAADHSVRYLCPVSFASLVYRTTLPGVPSRCLPQCHGHSLPANNPGRRCSDRLEVGGHAKFAVAEGWCHWRCFASLHVALQVQSLIA